SGRGRSVGRPRLWLHDQKRRGAQRVVGQGAQRLSWRRWRLAADPSVVAARPLAPGGSRAPRRPQLRAALLLGPATLAVAAGLLLPILILLRYSFNRFDPRLMMIEALTFDNYAKFFTDPFYTNILFTTLRVALIATAVCMLLALPLAYVLARSES